MFDWVMDFVRNLIFSLAMLASWMSDQIFSVLKVIALLDIGEFENLWIWHSLLLVFLTLFVTFRVFIMYFKALANEEYREQKYKPMHAVIGILCISLVIGIFPIATKFITSSTAYVIENTPVFLNAELDAINPSDIIITNTIRGLKHAEKDSIKEQKETYTMNEISKKLNEKEGKKYKYLPELWQLFFVIGIMIVFGGGMVLLAIQFAKRVYSIILKIIISPIPISSLVDPNSDKFGVWLKLLLADFITNFIQYLLLFVVLLTASSKFVLDLGFFVAVILLIGGLLFILEGVPQISHLIGGDVSTGSIMQQLSTIRMATRGFGHSIGKGVAFGAGVGLTAGAVGIYGAGRAAGAKGLIRSGVATQAMQQHITNSKSGENYFQNENTAQTSSQNTKITKDGSLANRFGNYAENTSGVKGGFANLASQSANHFYQKSANRLAKNPFVSKTADATNFVSKAFQKNATANPNQSQKQAFNQKANYPVSPDLDSKKKRRA